MKIGLCIFLTHYAAAPEETAKAAEDLGFESLWMPEHPCIPVSYDTPFPGSADGKVPRQYWSSYDPFVALSFAAAATHALKIGTGICLLAQRDPIVTAKEVASLDVLSHGRFLFGVGGGWLREEMELMGATYARRWAQVKDRMMAMKAIWTQPEAEYHGEFANFQPIKSDPKPLQKLYPPIHVGGAHPNSYKRVGEWADGWIPLSLTPAEVVLGREKIAGYAKAAGRDPGKIEISVFGQEPAKELLKEYADVGLTRYVVFVQSFASGEMQRQLAILAGNLGL
ncbi:MAG TPA: LLM class F420-dependent oxidoreductase [Acidobacteriota bacterium]|nr:LLM class F420-dependent oxidoreductase [Acidobacteriota bacterium]